MQNNNDVFMLGGHEFHSRFILGSGKYNSHLIRAAVEYADTEIVTLALRRANTRPEENILDFIPKNVTLLPNTSGARNAEEAIRIARLARKMAGTDFVKIEIMRDSKYLLPDNQETVKATETLANEGFVVMPYMYPDLNIARDLANAGAACIMPLASPIGSNKGLATKDFIQILIDEIDLSLHPTWQRRIVGILKELFPRIQFICATHSPFIIQSLEEGELITLDQPLESEYSGEGLEDIAEDIMGVVLPQYSEKKRKIYEVSREYFAALKDAKTPDEIEKLGKRLAELEAEYSENPAYMAWVHQQYTEQAWKVKKNETSR